MARKPTIMPPSNSNSKIQKLTPFLGCSGLNRNRQSCHCFLCRQRKSHDARLRTPHRIQFFLPQTLFAGAAAPRFSPQNFLGSAFCNHSTRRRGNEKKDILTNSENEERIVTGIIAFRNSAFLTLIRVVSIVRALVVLSFCFVPALFCSLYFFMAS